MEARVHELEALVQQLTEQRDELCRDIETLCLANVDGSCNRESSLLMQRVVDAEQQRDQTAAENEMLKAEKASLLEDMASIRQSKKQSDAYCRELTARFQEVSRQKAFFAEGDSQTEFGRSDDPDALNLEDSPKANSITEVDSDFGEERDAEEGGHEVSSPVNSSSTDQMEIANNEGLLLQERIRTLEENLEKRNQDLEKAQEDVRRSEHHVSMLLDQLEKAQSGNKDAKSAKTTKRSRSLQKKLDRLSVDLTKAFSKMQSKEDALSETEAEMDCMKRKHSADMDLVRQAFDSKFEETKKLVQEKEEIIQAQQHNVQILELEKRKLTSQLARRDVALSRLREELQNADSSRVASQASSAEQDQEILEHKRKIDGLESRMKMLERKLHHCNLRKEAVEKEKNQALVKASAYKKKYMVLKLRMKEDEGDQENGLPLLESNVHLHNFAMQWEDALKQTGGTSQKGGQARSRKARSRTGSIASRYNNVSLAQFALFALMIKGMENQQQQRSMHTSQ